MVFGRVSSARRALQRAYDAEDAEAVARAHAELTEVAPGDASAWFDRGLHAKRQRDWALAAECNERALTLEGEGTDNPSAWNLGIAATALGDAVTARRAWLAYGIALPPEDDPAGGTFGTVPVRLNPDPQRPGETPLLVDGAEHATEVVWIDRLSPAHGVVLNVPTPASGHRFRDVVLHDGVPAGERRSGDRLVPVFDELALLERSSLPTLEVDVRVTSDEDLTALFDAFEAQGLGATEWASTVRTLCRACSEGSPVDAEGHDHPPPSAADDERRVALAAPPEVAEQILVQWASVPGRSHGRVERAF